MLIETWSNSLQGTNISHLGKRNIIFKSDFWWDKGGYVRSLEGFPFVTFLSSWWKCDDPHKNQQLRQWNRMLFGMVQPGCNHYFIIYVFWLAQTCITVVVPVISLWMSSTQTTPAVSSLIHSKREVSWRAKWQNEPKISRHSDFSCHTNSCNLYCRSS